MLLGKDPRKIERHWDTMYARTVARWGGSGTEMRAISAIDAALWDILGQSLGTPIYQLLGGLAHDRIRTYNTCGGPLYGLARLRRGGEGKGPLEDLWAQINEPEVLAEELLGRRHHGHEDLAVRPDSRCAGDRPVDQRRRPARRGSSRSAGSARPSGTGSRSCSRATATGTSRRPSGSRSRSRSTGPAWLEDMVLGHDVEQIAELKASTSTPVMASEMLITRYQYRHAAGAPRRRHRDGRPDLGRRDHGVAQDHHPRGDLRPAGRDARLHRARSRCWPASTSR